MDSLSSMSFNSLKERVCVAYLQEEGFHWGSQMKAIRWSHRLLYLRIHPSCVWATFFQAQDMDFFNECCLVPFFLSLFSNGNHPLSFTKAHS